MIEKIPLQNPTLESLSLKAGLYVVATPIGNLKDITLRALEVLHAADRIACEDTRISGKLLKAYDIKTKMMPYHDHSDEKARKTIIDMIQSGQSVALISDAGMPLISDPGYKLVRDCHDQDIYVTTLPGANAPLSALQLSAFPTDQFTFLGFLPSKKMARQQMLSKWSDSHASLVAFETGPRLLKALHDIAFVMPGRDVAVVREITKMYEEVKKASVDELVRFYDAEGAPKGEIVLVIAPPVQGEYSDQAIEDMLLVALERHTTKEAAQMVAKQTGRKKSDLYDLALSLKNHE